MKSERRHILIFILLAGMAVGTPPIILAYRRFLPFSGRTTGIRTDLPISNFTLVSPSGRQAHLSDTAGQYRYVFFGFTRCPGVCPRMLGLFRRFEKVAGSGTKKPKFLFITIDPQHDTPPELARYFASFSSSFTGLTGSPEAIARVTREFGAQAARTGKDSIEHSSTLFVVDPGGRIALIYPNPPADAQTLLADLAILEDTNL